MTDYINIQYVPHTVEKYSFLFKTDTAGEQRIQLRIQELTEN